MKYFSQISPEWKNEKLGGSDLTIGAYGCFLTSIAILGGSLNPLELNEEGLKRGGFSNYGLLISSTIAKIVGLEAVFNTNGLNFPRPHATLPCIAITDYYKSRGVPTHFFVYLPDGRTVDPLDLVPEPKENKVYKITGYRHFLGVQVDQPKDWRDRARREAMDDGYTNGERPNDQLTRVELWETLRKFKERFGLN